MWKDQIPLAVSDQEDIRVVLVTKDFSIVIADDDQDDRSFIKEALLRRAFGGRFQCVEDGGQLLQYLKRTEKTLPDLILLDLNMPLVDGYQALSEIKQDPLLKSIPTMILTSSSKPEDEPVCYELGCDKFYRKPLSMGEYDDVASDILDYVRSV